MEYTEINIKENMPTVAEALDFLRDSIARFKREKYGVVLVIHGYGSTGKGGAICEKARSWLMAQKRGGKIKNVIFGENFDLFNLDALTLKNKCRELEPLLRVCNNGVTVVEL